MRTKVFIHGLILAFCAVFASVGDVSAAEEDPGCGCSNKPAENLLFNGDFKTMSADGRTPEGWTSTFPQHFTRIDLDGNRAMKAMQVTADPRVLGSYGVDLLSAQVHVQSNQRYRCSGYAVSTKPDMTVIVMGYGPVTRAVNGVAHTVDEAVYQVRKKMPATGHWEQFTIDLETRPVPEPDGSMVNITSARVLLWCHGETGNGWFGNIRLEHQGEAGSGLRATRLDGKSSSSAPTGAAAFDLQRAWSSATEAYRQGKLEQAARRVTELVDHAPGRGDFRALAARIMARQHNWPEASLHARRLLENEVAEPWQREWAMLVDAQARRIAGDGETARSTLEQLARSATSESARQEATRLLAQ